MLLQDLRYALRSLSRHPGFSLIAVLTLSLGIGATTAIFSVVRAVLLRPLEYPEPDRLVKIRGLNTEDRTVGNLSPGDFLDFQRDARTVEVMGANGFVGLFTISSPSTPLGASGEGVAERVGGVNVTAGFFPTLRVQAALGRVFTADDDAPGAPTTIVLSDGFWRRRFGGDPSIVGRAIAVNARPATVIGVLPADFRHIEINPERPADIFVPYNFNPADANRGGHFIRGIARLKDGVSIEQARAELDGIASRLERDFPVSNVHQGVNISPLLDSMVGDSRPVLMLLSAAVALVLLVACANVANLLLARGAGRMREFALRSAIGADRGRLVRQMLTESAALGIVGALGGVVLALAATRALTSLSAAGLPRADQVRLDGAALLFAIAAALITSVMFGLLPALSLSRRDLNESLRDVGKQQGAASGRASREALIVAEVAVSIVLLVGAGLLIRSLWQLQRVDPGFSAASVLAMEVSLPTARYEEGTQMPFYQQLHDRIAALPGVSGAGAVNILPLSSNYDSRGIQVEDHPRPDGQGAAPQARSATPGYFAAMGIPIISGRDFDARDTDDRQLVVIVSAAMARTYWPGESTVIGKRITFNAGVPRERQQVVGGPGSRVVVGVAGNVKHLGLDEEDVPMFYTPHTQQPSYHTMRVVVRSQGDPAGVTRMVREQLSQMDREVPLSQVTTLGRALETSVAAPRMRANLLLLFASIALALAAIGVYGVVAYIVGQRTQEIGVRRALGATAADVIGMLVREGLRPVAIGLIAGIAMSMGLTRLLAAMLFEVSATDAMAYLIAVGALAATALVASLVPARRALSVDPIAAVRGAD